MVLVAAHQLLFKVVILVAVQMVNLILHQTYVPGVIVQQLQIANNVLLCPAAHNAHLHSWFRVEIVAVPQPSIKVVIQTAHAQQELFKITIYAYLAFLITVLNAVQIKLALNAYHLLYFLLLILLVLVQIKHGKL